MAQEFGDFPVKCPTCLDEYYDLISTIQSAGKSVCPECKTEIEFKTFAALLQNDAALDAYLNEFLVLVPNKTLITTTER
jgi:hydrogenase maturation factor HypF (carbamoyltransferase family)